MRRIQHAIWLYRRFTPSYSDVGTGSKRAELSVTDNEPNREGAVGHPMIVRTVAAASLWEPHSSIPPPSDIPPEYWVVAARRNTEFIAESGTDGLHDSPLEEGVTSEPVSEMGFRIRGDSEGFIDGYRSVKRCFGSYGQRFCFSPEAAAPKNLILSYCIALRFSHQLFCADEFTVYKRAGLTPPIPHQAKNIIVFNKLEADRRRPNLPPD